MHFLQLSQCIVKFLNIKDDNLKIQHFGSKEFIHLRIFEVGEQPAVYWFELQKSLADLHRLAISQEFATSGDTPKYASKLVLRAGNQVFCEAG